MQLDQPEQTQWSLYRYPNQLSKYAVGDVDPQSGHWPPPTPPIFCPHLALYEFSPLTITEARNILQCLIYKKLSGKHLVIIVGSPVQEIKDW